MKAKQTKAKLIAASALIAALTMPALAQEEFYIAQDSSTRKCTVIAQKPTSSTMTIVGSGTAYKTRDEAEFAMKSVKACVDE
jgi:hypothetical protein